MKEIDKCYLLHKLIRPYFKRIKHLILPIQNHAALQNQTDSYSLQPG